LKVFDYKILVGSLEFLITGESKFTRIPVTCRSQM